MKECKAQTTLEVNCDCPHCDEWLDITDEAREYLDETLRAEEIELQITCEECGEVFIVTDITY
jgi:uncharacterized Zn finger protein